MSSEEQRVVVTGAGGFIGSHLVEQLVSEGASVRAFVRYNSRGDRGNLRYLLPELLRSVEVIQGDLRDPDAVRSVVSGSETVFHLGALIAIPYSYLHPREVVETNVLGTLNVLEAARAAGCGRVVHVSTSEVYGTARQVPIDEEHALQGQSPYSASKIGADKIAQSYHCAFDLPLVTVRPFNTFGPRQSARAVIPTIITQAITGGPIRLGRLSPTRDFTFVTDTARGMRLAAQASGVEGLEINLGNGEEIAIGTLADKIVSMLGSASTVESDEERVRPPNSEVERLKAAADLAAARLGWRPTVTLTDGLQRTIKWVEEHLAVFRTGEYQV